MSVLLLQISDTHFGTERPQVVEALVRFARAQAPDVLVLSGDVTQRATRAQFRAARAFVDRLAVPRTVVIPGNHDIPLFNLALRVLAPYARFRHSFGPALEAQVDLPGLLLLALNTTRWYRHVDGAVSARQIDTVARRLEAARPDQLRIVVTHQPIAVVGHEDDHNLLHGHRAALRRWAAAGADLVLGGHIHLPFLRALHDHVPDLARPMWALQAGTATSQRVRHGSDNSVNLVRVVESDGTPARCSEVSRWDYSPAADEFLPVDCHRLPHVGTA